jgi:ABC-2 type transport system ATP-binding protein
VAIIDSGRIIAIDTPDRLIDDLVAGGFQKPREVKQANLEDVFIHLTGHALRDE